MPILDSDLTDTGVFQLIPNGPFNGQTAVANLTQTKAGTGTMMVLDWEIVSGPNGDMTHAGRKIRFDNLMLAGKTKEGKPMPLGQLAAFIYYTGMPWTCKDCGTQFDEPHSLLIAAQNDATPESNLKVGNYYCPSCRAPSLKMQYDSDHFLNQRCGIMIGSQKAEKSDREYNIVRAYTDLLE